MYRILIVDRDTAARERLASFLGRRYHVAAAESAAAAIELLARDPCDLVIADIDLPDTAGTSLLDQVGRQQPHAARVLMTGRNVNSCLAAAARIGVSIILAKSSPLHETGTVVETLLTKTTLGLSPYLLPDGSMLGQYTIRSSGEAKEVRVRVATLLEERLGRNDDMNVLLDEVITNALYHATVRVDGTPKYRPFSEFRLEENEYVEVECGCDSEKQGVSVADNAGTLTARSVLETALRQVSGSGVLDSTGRGLHMCRMFADRMIINVKPGVRTEVILINYFTRMYRGSKPFYVNVL
jgi:CheY-like chemotaxis protein